MYLLDVNVWLALAFDTHVHHTVAKNWFDGLPTGRFVFCRMTQQGFLRLATDPRVLRSDAQLVRVAGPKIAGVSCRHGHEAARHQ